MAPRADLILSPTKRVPGAALRFSYARSAGPGGQNVNKVNTKAILRVALSELEAVLDGPALSRFERAAGRRIADGCVVLTSQAHRSSEANRRACLRKLQDLLERARRRPKTRKATRPTKASVERRLEAKQRRGRLKAQRRAKDDP